MTFLEMQELKKKLAAHNAELTALANYINSKEGTNEQFLPVITRK
jgi:hypothetical protein